MPEEPGTSGLPLAPLRLYSPRVLALYFILGNLPVGLALYGLNVARRGDRLFGYLALGVSLAGLVALMLAAMAGRSVRGWALLGAVVGLAIASLESAPYKRALRNGATTARWWPPLVAVLALLLAAALLPLG